MNTLGSSFQYSNRDKFSVTASFNWIDNQFSGNKNSPVAYQMLEGLQPGKNMTWVLGVQKRLMSFLDVNINYFGRSSEGSKTIHTGTVQLRASF
jgi:regulator of sigma D